MTSIDLNLPDKVIAMINNLCSEDEGVTSDLVVVRAICLLHSVEMHRLDKDEMFWRTARVSGTELRLMPDDEICQASIPWRPMYKEVNLDDLLGE